MPKNRKPNRRSTQKPTPKPRRKVGVNLDPAKVEEVGFFGVRPNAHPDEAYSLQTGAASPPYPGEPGGGVKPEERSGSDE